MPRAGGVRFVKLCMLAASSSFRYPALTVLWPARDLRQYGLGLSCERGQVVLHDTLDYLQIHVKVTVYDPVSGVGDVPPGHLGMPGF